MNNYTYIEKVTILKILIGNFLLVLGILGLLFINIKLSLAVFFFFIMLCFVGVLCITAEGIEIDFNRNRYRNILSLYGVKCRLRWSTYPKIEYIALVQTTIKKQLGVKGINASSKTISSKMVKINLFDINEKHKTIYYANNRKEALIIAENINRIYNVKILDNFV